MRLLVVPFLVFLYPIFFIITALHLIDDCYTLLDCISRYAFETLKKSHE